MEVIFSIFCLIIPICYCYIKDSVPKVTTINVFYIFRFTINKKKTKKKKELFQLNYVWTKT